MKQKYCGRSDAHSVHHWLEEDPEREHGAIDEYMCMGQPEPRLEALAQIEPQDQRLVEAAAELNELRRKADQADELEREVGLLQRKVVEAEKLTEVFRKKANEAITEAQPQVMSDEAKADVEAAFQRGMMHARGTAVDYPNRDVLLKIAPIISRLNDCYAQLTEFVDWLANDKPAADTEDDDE